MTAQGGKQVKPPPTDAAGPRLWACKRWDGVKLGPLEREVVRRALLADLSIPHYARVTHSLPPLETWAAARNLISLT